VLLFRIFLFSIDFFFLFSCGEAEICAAALGREGSGFFSPGSLNGLMGRGLVVRLRKIEDGQRKPAPGQQSPGLFPMIGYKFNVLGRRDWLKKATTNEKKDKTAPRVPF